MTNSKTWLSLALPLLLTCIPITSSWAAEQQPLRTLSVSGRGTATIPTSLTQVRVAVEVSGSNSKTVQQEAAQRSSKVLQYLRSRQVDKLKTTGISLSPTYSYENNRQKLTGYNATNSLSFQLPTAQAGAVIDDTVNAGATRIDSVNSIASEEAITNAQSQALQLATKDAQRQAQAVLSSLGFQPKEIIGIQVNDAARPAPLFMDTAVLAQKRLATTEVVGGDQEVQASVTLQIKY